MKHLFSVSDLEEDEMHLYSVKADDDESAKRIFTDKFLPYVPNVRFEDLEDFLSNLGVNIIYLGNPDKIKEI